MITNEQVEAALKAWYEEMTERYELVETKYDGEREVHISNVSWVMANALKDILEDKCAGRLTVEEMTNAARAAYLGEKG